MLSFFNETKFILFIQLLFCDSNQLKRLSTSCACGIRMLEKDLTWVMLNNCTLRRIGVE